MSKQLKDLKARIKALANKDELNEQEAGDLQELMNEAKALQFKQEAREFASNGDEADGETEPEDVDPRFKAISDKVEAITKALEKIPGLDAAGYLTNMGGTEDPKNKSFGDFLLAVKRADVKRLKGVYGSLKTLEEDGGATGGYLVPEEFRNELLKMGEMASQVVGLTTRVPVATDAGSYPALDQFTAPTAGVGDTAFAGGANLDAKAESATLPNNEPSFEEIKWRVNKIGDLVYVSNELNMDSPQSIEAILRSLFSIAIAAKEEYYVFRGTGSGEPLGILNSSATVAVTSATADLFAYADALTMISRFKSYLAPGRWFMHPSVFPDIGQWEIGTAGAGAPKIGDLGYGAPIFSEHLPLANANGDTLLCDLRAYLFFDRQGMTIDFSEHAAFTTDRVVWRVKERVDGMPWLKGNITLADPAGTHTVSPFVYRTD